jgi:vitellogenic carboxypeptidase-like protein
MKDGSYEFTKFLVEFLQKYPEFHNNSIYLTGESYAGKYLPLFTSDILTWNEEMEYYPLL